MEESRQVRSVLAFQPQGLGHVLQPNNRRNAVIDVELPHVVFPMDMGVEQSGDDEFSAEIDYLCARRGASTLGQQFANDIAMSGASAKPS